jgi:Domain of unknown function (DUF1707)
MDGVGRGFPPGEFRVSDADRDRALSELGEALRAGRITADEFDQRAGETLRARTGKELTALLADLPWPRPAATRAAAAERADHAFGIRAVMGASAFSAVLLSAKAVTDALSPGIGRAAGTMAPAVLAVLLVGLIIVLHATRADRS